MTRTIEVNVGLDFAHEGRSGEVGRIVEGRTKSRGIKPRIDLGDPAYYMSEAYFNLPGTQFFRDAGTERQHVIREGCTQKLLRNLYFGERCALAGGGRLILESRTMDSQQLHAEVVADEADHVTWLTPYVDAQTRDGPASPVARLIANVIENTSYDVLLYFAQIVLEGWAMNHYRQLIDGCNFEPLRGVFGVIYRDEAYHHQAGSILFDSDRLDQRDRAVVLEVMACHLEILRNGPIDVMAAISEAHGGMDKRALACLFEELSGAASAAKNLSIYRDLMLADGMEWVVESLEGRNLFTPVDMMDAANVVHSLTAGPGASLQIPRGQLNLERALRMAN